MNKSLTSNTEQVDYLGRESRRDSENMLSWLAIRAPPKRVSRQPAESPEIAAENSRSNCPTARRTRAAAES